ncbi:hypothetical protein [Humibacter ginsengisoli]
MKEFLGRMAERLAPRTMASLKDLAEVRERNGTLQAAFDRLRPQLDELVRENRRLRDEIDELRREGRHVAELYDLVVERVRSDAERR